MHAAPGWRWLKAGEQLARGDLGWEGARMGWCHIPCWLVGQTWEPGAPTHPPLAIRRCEEDP